jgi:hypothetical protein
MAYSKAKLKSNGDKAPPCFIPFLIGNIADKLLPTPILLYTSVRHIFISLASFRGIPNSMRMLYKPVAYSLYGLRYAGFLHILGLSALDLHYVSELQHRWRWSQKIPLDRHVYFVVTVKMTIHVMHGSPFSLHHLTL